MVPVVWITGGQGFIARNVARNIAAQGGTVFGVGYGSWNEAAAAEWSYARWFNGAVQFDILSRMAHAGGLPDIVYHVAGGSSVGASLQDPHEDFRRTVET